MRTFRHDIPVNRWRNRGEPNTILELVEIIACPDRCDTICTQMKMRLRFLVNGNEGAPFNLCDTTDTRRAIEDLYERS